MSLLWALSRLKWLHSTRAMQDSESTHPSVSVSTLMLAYSYGEMGYATILNLLKTMLGDLPNLAQPLHSIPCGVLMANILLPETALCLIAADLSISDQDTLEVIEQSAAYGRAIFKVDDCHEADNLMDTAARERAYALQNQKSKWSELQWATDPGYDSEGRELSYNAWAQNQGGALYDMG